MDINVANGEDLIVHIYVLLMLILRSQMGLDSEFSIDDDCWRKIIVLHRH